MKTKLKKYLTKNWPLVTAIIFLLIVSFTLGTVMTIQSSSALIKQIQSRMLDVANTAASMLDGDILASLKAEDEDTPAYQSELRKLRYFKDAIELEYIYCIRDMGVGADGKERFAFTIDPEEVAPGQFGQEIAYTDALYAASKGTPSVDKEPYTDVWGRFYSAYSPVYCSDGSVGGIVAVDFNADWFDSAVGHQIRTVVFATALSLIIGIVIAFLIARRNNRRNRALSAKLGELAGRVEELVTEIGQNDPTGLPMLSASPAKEPDDDDDLDAIGKRVIAMQDAIRSHLEHIRTQAYVDMTTGVNNKTAFSNAVAVLENKIAVRRAAFGIVVFDLIGLKSINDSFGHESGDSALADAAAVLSRTFGREHVYRIGGDEFAVIVDHATDDIMKWFYDLFDRELDAENKKDKPYKCTLAISRGSAIYSSRTDPDFKTTFKRADSDMYLDKQAYYDKHKERDRRR